MPFTIRGRPLGTVARSALQPRHYRALAETFRVSRQPLADLRRYALGGGGYPYTARLRTPVGDVSIRLDTPDDVLTLNEVFFRRDYAAGPDARVVVDLGSNIGVSALYFLTRSREARCHCFEPVPRNAARLRDNLRAFEGRWTLTEAAVADRDGEVEFGVEPTGRYGGIGVETGETIRVPCLDVNDVLAQVVEREGRVDVLKVDTEGQEEATVAAIHGDLAERIGVIYLEEGHVPVGPLHPGLFERSTRGSCIRLQRRSRPG